MYLLRKIVSKNRFPQPLSTLPKTFYPVAQPIKVNWASCISWRSSWELFKLRSAADLWPGQNTLWVENNFFQLLLPFEIVYHKSHTWKIALSVCLLISLSISWVHMWPRGCAKSLLVEFPENIFWGNAAFWENFCFRISCSSLNTQLSTFGTSLLWESIC